MMLEPRDSVEGLLLWAAGFYEKEPDFCELEPDYAAGVIGRHKLDGEFLRRVRSVQKPMPRRLVRAVTEQYKNTSQIFQRHLAEAARLTSILSDSYGTDVILLKGLGPFALTGDQALVRSVKDIDLLARDPAAALSALVDLGYTEYGHRERIHEYAHLRRDGIEIDLHSFFPITVHDVFEESELLPQAHLGIWKHRAHLTTRRAYYDEVAEVSSTSSIGSHVVVTPCPELTVIFLSAQLHRDYVRLLIPVPLATIKLGDFALIRRLMEANYFDHQRYELLASTFEADTALTFVTYIAQMLGDANLAAAFSVAPISDDYVPLRDLWCDSQDGFLVSLSLDVRDLLIRRTPASSLVKEIGPARVSPGVNYFIGADHLGEGVILPRAVVREYHGSIMPMSLRIDKTDDKGLTVSVVLPQPTVEQMAILCLKFGDYDYEVFSSAEGSELANYSQSIGQEEVYHEVHMLDGQQKLIITLPYSRMPRSEAGLISVVLGARLQPLPWGRVQGEVVVPLEISV